MASYLARRPPACWRARAPELSSSVSAAPGQVYIPTSYPLLFDSCAYSISGSFAISVVYTKTQILPVLIDGCFPEGLKIKEEVLYKNKVWE
jgi:hypothetical protein